MQERLAELLSPYRGQKNAALTALLKVQDELGYLPRETAWEVARVLGISPNEVYGAASFYAQFRFDPGAEHTVKVCWGPSCHLRGAKRLMKVVEEELEGWGGQKGRLEPVPCAGACAQAPVMGIDEDLYGQVTQEKAKELLAQLMQAKGGRRGRKSP